MSFVKRYVPKQIQNVFDRIAAKNDRELQSALAEPRPRTFEVIVYDYSDPQTRNQLIEIPEGGDPDIANLGTYFKYRARSLVGQHDHWDPPEDAETKDEYEKIRSNLYQALWKVSADGEVPQTGDVYKATIMGEDPSNLISLDEKVRTSGITTSFSKKAGSSAFGNGLNAANILANYTEDSETKFLDINYKNNQAQRDFGDPNLPYMTFGGLLRGNLRFQGFKASSITMNSTFRTPENQVDAMIGSRYAKGKDFFLNWFKTNYSDSVERQLLPTIESNFSTQAKLREAMIKKVKQMKAAGTLVSAHMRSGAVDIRSNDLTFEDCEIMEGVIAKLKADNIVKSGKWEGVADVTGGRTRRKVAGVFDENEHFHITLIVSAAGE